MATPQKGLSSEVQNLISILKSNDGQSTGFNQQGKDVKQSEQYGQIKSQINKYIKTCYQKKLEGKETFRVAKQSAEINMIHNRSANKSSEVKQQYRKSNMFTPELRESRMRKESVEYMRNKGLNNSTGEMVIQNRRRVPQ